MKRHLPIGLAAITLLACSTLTSPVRTPTLSPPSATNPIAVSTPEATRPPGRPPTPQPTPAVDFADLSTQRSAMRPEHAADVDPFADAARYFVEARFEPGAPARLDGIQRVRFTNRESAPIEDLVFNLYANTAQFLGGIALGAVWVDGESVDPDLNADETVLRIPLADPLAPGESADVTLEWQETVRGGLGTAFARFGESAGVYSMVSFVPLLAHRASGEWQVEPQAFTGDPVTSDTALFVLRITAAAGLDVIATGTAIETQTNPDGTQTVTFGTGPVRDVALIVGDLSLSHRAADGVRVNFWLLPEHEAQAADLLRIASDSLRLFERMMGRYPYAEVDYVDVPGFGGIEYPGLVILGVVGNDPFLEVVVAHETAHQWFYGLIGDDQLNEPWLDEGMASYLEVAYFRVVYGAARGEGWLDGMRREWQGYADRPELPVGLSVAEYRSGADYFTLVYSKAAVFLDELRQTMGDAAFDALLRRLYAGYRYGFLTTTDFHAEAEVACTCELDALFELWVTKGGELPTPGP